MITKETTRHFSVLPGQGQQGQGLALKKKGPKDPGRSKNQRSSADCSCSSGTSASHNKWGQVAQVSWQVEVSSLRRIEESNQQQSCKQSQVEDSGTHPKHIVARPFKDPGQVRGEVADSVSSL